MNSEVHPEGWIALTITPEHEEQAKLVRAERDRRYPNIFHEEDTDKRWVGELGEWAFNSWLNHERIEGFDWIRDNAAGKPDFTLAGGVRVGVKTVKRKAQPRSWYTAQITARHIDEPVEQYFFLSYDFIKRVMWFLGGIEHARFKAGARYHAAGEQPHDNYTVREGHEIYNIEIDRLVKPREWLNSVT